MQKHPGGHWSPFHHESLEMLLPLLWEEAAAAAVAAVVVAAATAAAKTEKINSEARGKTKEAKGEIKFLLPRSLLSGLMPTGAAHNWAGLPESTRQSEQPFRGRSLLC